MGVRGLSTYIHEHLNEVLERHKLHRRQVVIDGNNLAHMLYYECTGINAAFGGDYDKYASFVESYFEGLLSCEVHPVIVMDGGQPIDNQKMNTVRDRIYNQIQTCLDIRPSNQYRLKVFPCMGRQVFVSTLKKMGIVVLQTDFEADKEIAMLAKKLELTVLSNDSDFYVFDVPFILLNSVNYKKINTGKKENSKESFSYISCYQFNLDKFCELTGLDPAHLPILATVLGNDYLAFDHFTDFYSHLGGGQQKSRMSSRHSTIKNVFQWLSKQKGKDTDQVIANIAKLCNRKKMKKKMQASMSNYTDVDSNLISLVSENSLKQNFVNLSSSDSSIPVECPENEEPGLIEVSNIETSLVLKNGRRPPHWFVSAYRNHRIPHEVADIVTQSYFISPPQVEEKSSASAYLLVEPIVRIVYTMLWQGHRSRGRNHKHLRVLHTNVMSEEKFEGSTQMINDRHLELPKDPLGTDEMHDSDVVVEDDGNGSSDNVVGNDEEENFQVADDDDKTNDEIMMVENSDKDCAEIAIDNKKGMKRARTGPAVLHEKKEVVNDEILHEDLPEAESYITSSNNHCLRWYLRAGRKLWITKVPYLPDEIAHFLPSLSEVGSMSVSERQRVFYSVLCGSSQITLSDLPGDVELILDFIIFWFQRSASPLIDVHAMSVLMCVFMFYVIDGKVGRVRTKKAFEDEEKWKTKFSIIKNDEAYCIPSAGVKDLLQQVTQEECLLAGCRLFKFHHMNQRITDKFYNRQTVHAFSEYQACIYFMQLLNSLLCHPFPLLSIEHLWGGTFCYNLFYDLKKKSNPLMRVSELLGRGSCLERVFLLLFKQLSEILNFKKCIGMVNFVENLKGPRKNKRLAEESAERDCADHTSHKRKRRKTTKKRPEKLQDTDKSFGDKAKSPLKKGQASQEESESEEQEYQPLDNRFAGLLLCSLSDNE